MRYKHTHTHTRVSDVLKIKLKGTLKIKNFFFYQKIMITDKKLIIKYM